MKLSNKELNVLDEIARQSKEDCWFCLKSTNKYDYVYDLEMNKRISLVNGIRILDSGLTDLEDYSLTKEEKECYKEILEKIKEPKDVIINDCWENKYIHHSLVCKNYVEHFDKYGAMLYRLTKQGKDVVRFYLNEKDYNKVIKGE